jgi:hypothetical protein
MGYTTEFFGEIAVDPPLNEAEITYLRRFAGTRRMGRSRGPYFVDSSGFHGQGDDPDIRDHNAPPIGQPGLWCQWVPNDAGTALAWDGGEKFYEADRWMAYLIEHFLKPGADAFTCGDSQFEAFTFDHLLEGEIEAQGEEPDDRWILRITRNRVSVAVGRTVYSDPEPIELTRPG